MDIKKINKFISFLEVKEDNKDYDINSFLDTVKELMGRLPEKGLLHFISEYGFSYFKNKEIQTISS